MTRADIIIAGAGISGLLLGYELSKYLSILILEKQEEKPQTKYWVTLNNIDIDSNIKEFVDVQFDSMEFISHEFEKYSLKGDYLLWDTDKLCEYLKTFIRNNNGKILYNHRVYSKSIKESYIEVFANATSFKSQILIDCMGYYSPIVHTHHMAKILGYHYLYGKTLKLKQNINPVCLANVMLQKQAAYLEIFPDSKQGAHVTIIKPISKLQSLNHLKEEFNFIISKSAYSKYFEDDQDKQLPLGGVVPVGLIRKKALNRVFLYGESAQHNPAATGTCLSRLFKNYKKVAAHLVDKINQQDFSAKSLSSLPSDYNRLSSNFQINLFKEMLSWNSVKFSKFLKMLDCLPNESVNDFLFDEIKLSHFADINTVLKLLRSGQYLWIKPFLKSLS